MKSVKKYSRQVIAALFAVLVCISSFACEDSEESPILPTYAPQDFVTFGFWSPYELTEESFTLYKQSGLNTMFFGNHSSRPWSSDNLHYLSSNATQLSLELCKKVGVEDVALTDGETTLSLAYGEGAFIIPYYKG